MKTIMTIIKDCLIKRNMLSCIHDSVTNSPCSLLNKDGTCLGCVHEKGANLLVTIGLNLLAASINHDESFDIINEIDKQVELVKQGKELIVDELKFE